MSILQRRDIVLWRHIWQSFVFRNIHLYTIELSYVVWPFYYWTVHKRTSSYSGTAIIIVRTVTKAVLSVQLYCQKAQIAVTYKYESSINRW